MILGMSRRFAPFSFLLQALLVWFLCSGAGAAPPPFEDSMAQRVLACTACHGDQGRAGPDGYYPRLAGKPAGYLHHQLLNFRDGRRHYGLMTRMVDPLSDAYLLEIARHFSSLELPYPPPDIPGLLGLPRDYLNAQIGAWQTQQRRAHAPDCMAQIAGRMDATDVSAVAAWLAAQPVPMPANPATVMPPAPPGAPRWRCGRASSVSGKADSRRKTRARERICSSIMAAR